ALDQRAEARELGVGRRRRRDHRGEGGAHVHVASLAAVASSCSLGAARAGDSSSSLVSRRSVSSSSANLLPTLPMPARNSVRMGPPKLGGGTTSAAVSASTWPTRSVTRPSVIG